MAGLRRVVAFLVGAALVVAGCDTSSPAGSLPSSSARPFVSASPFVAQPVPPAQVGTWEGAIEFVRYFWALYNYAYASHDTAPLESVSSSSCSVCEIIVENVASIRRSRTRIEGGEVTVLEAASPPVTVRSGSVVRAALRQEDGRAVGANGKTALTRGFDSRPCTVSLTWDGTEWSVDAISVDALLGKS